MAGEGDEINKARSRIEGEVVIKSTDLSLSLAIIVGLFIIGPLLFAAFTKYSQKETVTGWLVPEQGIIRVVAREGGVLESLAVTEGALVKQGQPIGILRLTANTKDAEDAPAATARSIAAELTAQKAWTSMTLAQSEQKHLGIVQQRAAVQRQLDQLEQVRGRVLAQLAVSSQNLERSRELADRGFVSKQRYEDMQVTNLGFQREAAASQASIEGLRGQLASFDAQALALVNERGTISAKAAADMAQLEQRRISVETQNQYLVKTPIAGQIAALPLQVSQVASAASTVAIVLPNSSKLLAELYVPSRAAGFIKLGQKVRLMYDAYPYEKYGVGEGTIQEVSATALTPDEVAMPGKRSEDPVYRVRVALKHATVTTADGKSLALKPGGTLKADIIIERRSLLEWLLEPVFRAGKRT